MALESGSDVWAQVYEHYERAGFELDELSEPEQFALLAMLLDEQVTTGGFEQFFRNSTGDAARVVEAMESMGAEHLASLVGQANALFPEGSPAHERDDRDAQLDAFGPSKREALSSLDEAFHQSEEDLEDLTLLAFQKTPDAFPGPPPEEVAVMEWASQVADAIQEEGGVKDLASEVATFFHAADTIYSLRKMGIARYLLNLGWYAESAAQRTDALRSVGALPFAELVAEAHGAFPGGAPPSDQDEIVAVLEAMDEATLNRLADLEGELRKRSAEATLALHAWTLPHAALFSALQTEA